MTLGCFQNIFAKSNNSPKGHSSLLCLFFILCSFENNETRGKAGKVELFLTGLVLFIIIAKLTAHPNDLRPLAS